VDGQRGNSFLRCL